jgi:hypothetical protein
MPGSATAGSPFSVTATAKDALNNTAIGYSGTVQFTSSDAAAILPADSTLTAGSGTFSVTLDTPGPQTVVATDTADPSLTGQTSLPIIPGTAASFDVTGIAGPASPGVATDVTVTARDSVGNVATGYTGTVQFSSTDGSAVLPGDYPFTPGNSGNHTFSGGVTLNTSGPQSVTVTDAADNVITGSQAVMVDDAPCLPSLAITDPPENVDGYAVVYRAADFPIDTSLGGGCTGAWSYSWTYGLGGDAAQPVPATWTGSSDASLTVPKWTLEKYPTALHEYLFTVTATPPPGSASTPQSASVHLRVLGTVAHMRYSPAGFGTVPPGETFYTSQTTDPDNPPGQAKLTYYWEAVSDQGPLIAPLHGATGSQVDYLWDPAYGFVTLSLTACPSDEPPPEDFPAEPGRMFTGCGFFSDNFLILS